VIVALLALAFAVPAAVFVVWPLVTRREAAALASATEETRAALEAEKVQALRAIRELEAEHQAGLLTATDHAELRARLEAGASAILKRLDALPPPAAPAEAPANVRAPGRKAPRRGTAAAPATPARAAVAPRVPWTQRPLVLTGGALGLLVFGVVLGVLVVQYTAPAPADPMAAPPPMAALPGLGEGAGLGATPPEAGGESPRPIPPAMLEGMLRAAHQALDAGQYQQAIAAYKAVLKRHPDNVDAITHLGVILAVAGHADGALEAFERALAIQPDYPHALWDKGRVLYEQRQDYAGAIAAWERFVAVSGPGEDRDRAQALIQEARTKLAAATPAAGGSAPRPGAAGGPAPKSGAKPAGPAGAKP
jgi:tetratricopeptide (TPR) repeat protein